MILSGMKRGSLRWVILLATFVGLAIAKATDVYVPSSMEPPGVPREFRGAWVATVANIDWPSKPGLTVEQQKSELISLLEKAHHLNLNAILFQVRPACDAMYDSKYEPWSYYLTGLEGKAPEPFYAPLAYIIEQAHSRCMELHAWFNPFRASHPSLKSAFPKSHISKQHPDWVRPYGQYLWLDPGERAAREYSIKVVMDVVKRYDVDGVVFDDYYYPYKEKDSQKRDIDFPDERSWKKFGIHSGLSRGDWRRENVNSFVKEVYQSIKSAKPYVKFGISPFGIWQPGYPQQIKGFNSFAELYSDSRKWLQNGWVDYFVPQLYWSTDSTEQNFLVLLKWWNRQNQSGRYVWPGLSNSKVGTVWKADEILNQCKTVRSNPGGSPGVVHWSMKTLMEDRGNLAASLHNSLYPEPALVPPSPWLDSLLPSKPRIEWDKGGTVYWKSGVPNNISYWLVQTRSEGKWTTRIAPRSVTAQSIGSMPEVISVTGIDRCGVASPSATLERKPLPVIAK